MNDGAILQYSKEHPKRDVAVVGLRDLDGNILLLRTHKLPDFWQPVGGGIEPNDTSPKAAAARELREEFGIAIDAAMLTDVLTTPYDFGEGTIYFFDVIIERDNTEFNVNPSEVVEYRWFSKEEALTLPSMAATHTYLQQLAK